jgi:YD repeat-containing protein
MRSTARPFCPRQSTKHHTAGEQSSDGLARIEWRSVGGRTSKRSYQGNAPQPCEITTPKGEHHRLAYEPVLDYALTNLTYDNQTVWTLESKKDYSTREQQYLPSGLVARESTRIKDGMSFSSQSTCSMAGKLQSYTDVHGQEHEIQYDRFGRPQRLAQGTLTVTLAYDQTSRLSESCVQGEAANLNLTTRFSYDDFGREVERTVHNGQEMLYRLSQTFDKTSLVTTWHLEDGESNIIRHESFQYDSHNRLTDYQCRSGRLPTDEQGHPLQSQQFSFDDFDNLIQVSTVFKGGSKNIACYTY